MNWAPECKVAYDGAAMSVLLFALPLAMLITLITLLLYRRAVGRAMRAAAPDSAPLTPASATESPPPPLELQALPPDAGAHDPLLRRAYTSARRLSAGYAVAGITHALISVVIYFRLSGLELLPFRTLLVAAIFAWPVVVVWTLTAIITRRQKWALIAAYFAVLLGLEIVAETMHLRHRPAFGQLFLLWALNMGPQTVVLAPLSNRAWRPVGLISLFVAIVLVGAFLLGFQFFGCLVLTARSDTLLSIMPYAQGILVIACAIGAWLLLRRLAQLHDRKRTSDLMFTVDSWWLLVTAIQVLMLLGPTQGASVLMMLAYVAYKLVLHFWLKTGRPDAAAAPRSMLLLRVFGHTARTRTLTDQVGQAWRQVGPINMIGGTNLATSLIEPDELIAFWSGRLRQQFVAGAADLRARIERLDERPDPDGRYRINEFFCHDNTWRATVQVLAQRSAVVLMDLRGFGKRNLGCEFELSLLLSEIPLARVVLLVDESTRMEELRPLLLKPGVNCPGTHPTACCSNPACACCEWPATAPHCRRYWQAYSRRQRNARALKRVPPPLWASRCHYIASGDT